MEKLTEEQQLVIDSLKRVDKLRVNAFAGTGKTTTLIHLIKVYPNKRFLITAFNQAIKQELAKRVESNATVYTLHGLAYQFLSYEERQRLGNNGKVINDIICYLDGNYTVGKFAYYLLEAWCNSPFVYYRESDIKKLLQMDKELKIRAEMVFSNALAKTKGIKARSSKLVSLLTNILEEVIKGIEKGHISLTHNYYLKRFQQRLVEKDREIMNFLKRFDVVLVDEAQDMNSVQRFILEHSPIKQAVVVGDRHQSIYSWRGALNTLALLKDWEVLYLTNSFRFKNTDIVYYANKILSNYKNESKKMKAMPTNKINNETAYITRTNAEIVELIDGIDRDFKTIRNLDEIFETVRNADKIIKYLQTNKEEELKSLPDYVKMLSKHLAETYGTINNNNVGDIINTLNNMEELEYAKAINIAWKRNIEKLYEKAKKYCSTDSKTVFTTAHSCKGKEFRKVVLANDFPNLLTIISQKEGATEDIIAGISDDHFAYKDVIDEINLQYVAITRAIEDINLSFNVATNINTKLTKDAIEDMKKKLGKTNKKNDKEIEKEEDTIQIQTQIQKQTQIKTQEKTKTQTKNKKETKEKTKTSTKKKASVKIKPAKQPVKVV